MRRSGPRLWPFSLRHDAGRDRHRGREDKGLCELGFRGQHLDGCGHQPAELNSRDQGLQGPGGYPDPVGPRQRPDPDPADSTRWCRRARKSLSPGRSLRRRSTAPSATPAAGAWSSSPSTPRSPSLAPITSGINQDWAGAGPAEWLAEELGGKGNIVFMGGIPGNMVDLRRNAAAKAVFADFPTSRSSPTRPACGTTPRRSRS